jgi:hypothetical protein
MKIKETDLENLVHYINVPNITSRSKFILDRCIRSIHASNEFEITELVEIKLKELNLYKTSKLSRSKAQTLNRKLKKNGFNDFLTIEHLYSVKKMINDLIILRDNFDGKSDTQIVYEYFVNKTNCVYKFDKAEKELQG